MKRFLAVVTILMCAACSPTVSTAPHAATCPAIQANLLRVDTLYVVPPPNAIIFAVEDVFQCDGIILTVKHP
jgi:hypothetical protein